MIKHGVVARGIELFNNPDSPSARQDFIDFQEEARTVLFAMYPTEGEMKRTIEMLGDWGRVQTSPTVMSVRMMETSKIVVSSHRVMNDILHVNAEHTYAEHIQNARYYSRRETEVAPPSSPPTVAPTIITRRRKGIPSHTSEDSLCDITIDSEFNLVPDDGKIVPLAIVDERLPEFLKAFPTNVSAFTKRNVYDALIKFVKLHEKYKAWLPEGSRDTLLSEMRRELVKPFITRLHRHLVIGIGYKLPGATMFINKYTRSTGYHYSTSRR